MFLGLDTLYALVISLDLPSKMDTTLFPTSFFETMQNHSISTGMFAKKIAEIENWEKKMSDTGFDPLTQAKKIIENSKYDAIIATGYGRTLLGISFDIPTVTEIKAHAKGAFKLFHDAFFILDIGGQDSKVIRLNDQGRVIKFEINDRCAAGTGNFLEIMAKSLGFTINECRQDKKH